MNFLYKNIKYNTYNNNKILMEKFFNIFTNI